MRQMDVVSGLINVLTGLCFSGRTNEGVHKSGLDICSVSKTGVILVWSPHSHPQFVLLDDPTEHI